MIATRKRKRRGSRIIVNILILICAVVLVYSAYNLISYYLAGKKAEDAYVKLRYVPTSQQTPPSGADGDYSLKKSHYESLYKKNSDFVGWVRIPGMRVDYPVMQTPNDEQFYLHRDFQKNYSVFGCIFASAISDVNRPSDVITLYGHKMKNGSMFGSLSDLESKSFAQKHRYIFFDTLKQRRSYEIFCVFRTDVSLNNPNTFKYYDYSDFTDENNFAEFISGAQKRQFFDTWETVEYGDRFLMLSTCEYSSANGRLIVLAKEVPNSKVPKKIRDGA